MVYVVVVRVVAVVGAFESVSTAAAAAAVSVVVDVAVPACCRPPGLNLQPRCFCLRVFIVRVCAAVAAAAAVVLYSLRSFPHRGRCLPSLLLLLFTWYAVGGGAVAVPARSRPLTLNTIQKTC